MPWVRGQSGNPAGVKRGKPRGPYLVVREKARQLFDARFWRATHQRMIEGKEPPQLVSLYLAYAFGKPKDDDKPQHTNVSIGALSVLPTLGQIPAAALQVSQRDKDDEVALPVIPAKPQ